MSNSVILLADSAAASLASYFLDPDRAELDGHPNAHYLFCCCAAFCQRCGDCTCRAATFDDIGRQRGQAKGDLTS
eukprot:300666-Pyramimonas_sp.AAC.1